MDVKFPGSRFWAIVAALAAILSGLILAVPASASTISGALPDPWLACSKTVPAVGWVDVAYAGIYANPYYNSRNTYCRDMYVSTDEDAGFQYWYKARPVP